MQAGNPGNVIPLSMGSLEILAMAAGLTMNPPKMILFDYGQTLANERKFDGIAGTEAVLKYAIKNKYNRTAADIQAVADAINNELGRFDSKRHQLFQVEVPNYMFTAYLYESQGIASGA